MSLYTRGEPASNHQFRANTEKRAGQMIGVTTTPARALCRCCGKMRTAVTGKYSKSGKFICGMCHKLRMVS